MTAGCSRIARNLTEAELIDGYESWFLNFMWSIWGTLTFRGSPSIYKATKLFNVWIDEIKQGDGKADFRWVRVMEKGAFGDNVHFHVLLGGLRDGSKFPWMFQWEKLAGTADLYYFDSSRGGIRYLLKSVEPGKDFFIDYSLPIDEEEQVAFAAGILEVDMPRKGERR